MTEQALDYVTLDFDIQPWEEISPEEYDTEVDNYYRAELAWLRENKNPEE